MIKAFQFLASHTVINLLPDIPSNSKPTALNYKNMENNRTYILHEPIFVARQNWIISPILGKQRCV